ncbi:MAG: transposase [Proteobacteria bacterium]|nr:transposase [Pseudomonadota bacterium]
MSTPKRASSRSHNQGGDITSDGGVLLLKQVDHRLGLSEAVVRALNDPRRQAIVVYMMD